MTQQQMTLDQAIDLALEHHRAGRLHEAESIYRQILQAHPRHPDALHLMGVLSLQADQPKTALDFLDQALAMNPDVSEIHSNYGEALRAAGRFDEAITAYQKAISLKPENAQAHNNLGSAFQAQGRWDEAIASHRKAIEIHAEFPSAHSNLGNALRERGLFSEAIFTLRHCLSLDPTYPEAMNNLGNALQQTGKFDEAIEVLRQAIGLRPGFSGAHYNLGLAMQLKGRHDEALSEFRQAADLEPNSASAHNNFAAALHTMGRFNESTDSYRHAIELQPEFALAHHNLGLSLLLQGQFDEGWIEHEWRWRIPRLALFNQQLAQPKWDGNDLDGRTILLRAEQGFGDAIQFARYVPMVAERGGRTILACRPEQVRLMRSLDGVEQLATHGDRLPEFDVHCSLLSLPALFKTTLETIPANVPYLHADPHLSSRWRDRMTAGTLKVGLAWAGLPTHQNDRFRSISPQMLKPLVEIPGIQLFSLQKGPAAKQGEISRITDWTQELSDFADTAALIDHLDLVISVDTSVAHLAGAMGKRVWVLLPFVPDWRWLLKREDSPWYPTMRLFRQSTLDDWRTPLDRIATELRVLAGGGSG